MCPQQKDVEKYVILWYFLKKLKNNYKNQRYFKIVE